MISSFSSKDDEVHTVVKKKKKPPPHGNSTELHQHWTPCGYVLWYRLGSRKKYSYKKFSLRYFFIKSILFGGESEIEVFICKKLFIHKNFFQENSQTKCKQTGFVYSLFAKFPDFCGDATTFFLHIKTSISDSPTE